MDDRINAPGLSGHDWRDVPHEKASLISEPHGMLEKCGTAPRPAGRDAWSSEGADITIKHILPGHGSRNPNRPKTAKPWGPKQGSVFLRKTAKQESIKCTSGYTNSSKRLHWQDTGSGTWQSRHRLQTILSWEALKSFMDAFGKGISRHAGNYPAEWNLELLSSEAWRWRDFGQARTFTAGGFPAGIASLPGILGRCFQLLCGAVPPLEGFWIWMVWKMLGWLLSCACALNVILQQDRLLFSRHVRTSIPEDGAFFTSGNLFDMPVKIRRLCARYLNQYFNKWAGRRVWNIQWYDHSYVSTCHMRWTSIWRCTCGIWLDGPFNESSDLTCGW